MIVILSIIVSVFLILASTGLWVERQIFNKDNFKTTAVEAIRTVQVRDAIANRIIISLTGSFPRLSDLAQKFVKPSLADFLNGKLVKGAVNNIAGEIQTALTSPKPKAISIDISALTGPAKTAANIIPKLDPDIKNAIKQLPPSIELIKKGVIPSIFTVGLVLMWLGRITGVAALIIVGYMVWKAVVNRESLILKTLGIYISIGTALYLLLIWAFASPLLATIGDGDIRVIISKIFDAFTRILINQTWLVLIGGLLIVAGGYLLQWFREEDEVIEPEAKAEIRKAA
ncbi:MAG TPA: hypothetical protein ENH19_00265 [Actinobacteria bacterium]|nr:hypothetical protein [Actinomycetes bacterium]HEX21070.1 hypothetical protein [Actinomycetota bacterium]